MNGISLSGWQKIVTRRRGNMKIGLIDIIGNIHDNPELPKVPLVDD
jgi:hypothetical protein